MDNNDYYELLGITKDASQEEIKAAYRDLVKRYHPDVNPARNAAVMFRVIHAAYEVLSDPVARRAYDTPQKQKTSQESTRDPSREQPHESHSYQPPQKPMKERGSIFISGEFWFSELFESKFVVLESVLVTIVGGFLLHHFFTTLHIALCIAGGCAGGFLLLLLFNIKIGVWLVGIVCSLFWGWFAADIAYSVSGHDTKTTLIWGIGTLLLTAAFHIKEASEL